MVCVSEIALINPPNIPNPINQNGIENNANNIISIRTIGVAADPLEHMEYSAQNAFTQIKDVSKGIFGVIKDELKSKITEKTPIIKRKVKLLKNKILK